MKVKSLLVGMAIGVFVGILTATAINKNSIEVSSSKNNISDQKKNENHQTIRIDDLDFELKATTQVLEQIKRVNRNIESSLLSIESDNNLSKVEAILNKIPVDKAKTMKAEETNVYSGLIRELATLGFLCQSRKIVGMCDLRMYALKENNPHIEAINESHSLIIDMQKLLLKKSLLVQIDTSD